MSARPASPQPDPGSGWLTLHEAAGVLGVHYMTMYRYVRTGRLAARRSGGRWWVEPHDLEGLSSALAEPGNGVEPARSASPGSRTRTPSVRRRVSAYPRQLVSRLEHGDEPGAWAIVEAALAGGAELDEVYLDLLGPAMRIIGDRWANGLLPVAREHIASATMTRIIGRLGTRVRPIGRRSGVVVLGAAPGDRHGLPVHLLADLVRLHRFEVIDLGADPTPESLADALSVSDEAEVVAIGIGCTTPDNDASLAAAVRAVRAVSTVPVFAGGSGIDEATALAAGVDWFTRSAREAIGRLDQLRRHRAARSVP